MIFCWGDDTSDPDNIKYLKELGLHAVIYDKIDQYAQKDRNQDSTFLLEARESKKDLILLHANSLEQALHEAQSPRVSKNSQFEFFDEDKARQSLIGLSTASSLSSLQSNDKCGEKNLEANLPNKS